MTQAGVVCTFSVSPTTVALSPTATSLSIDVTTGGSCAWSASSAATWITFSGGGGPGSGDATFNVSANTTGAERTGTLTVAGQTVTVTQAGTCAFTVAPTTQSVLANGGSHSAAGTTTSGCGWTGVSNNTSWITVTGGSSGTGNGTVAYTVAANAATSSRTGTLTIAGQTVTVTQAGACNFTVAPDRKSTI